MTSCLQALILSACPLVTGQNSVEAEADVLRERLRTAAAHLAVAKLTLVDADQSHLRAELMFRRRELDREELDAAAATARKCWWDVQARELEVEANQRDLERV